MAMFLNTPLPYKRYKKISETTYFVDKSLILNDIFGCMEEETQYICITRPRRFGKTIMANMLGAFFGRVWDASQIFDHLKIADSPEYHQYLNQYDIIYIDFSRLPENCTSYRQYIDRIITGLKNDLRKHIRNIRQTPYMRSGTYFPNFRADRPTVCFHHG